MKKFICLLLSAVFASGTIISTFGAEGTIYNGKTMVPVRGVFEELGFAVSWNSTTASATISNNDYTIVVPKGKTYFMVNGMSIKPDVPQQVINGSLYLPLRAIGDSIGAVTSWDGTNKLAHINYNGMNSYVVCGTPDVSSAATYTPDVSSRLYINDSQINGVSITLYDSVMSYISDTVTAFNIDPLSVGTDEIQNQYNYFMNMAKNEQEIYFVSSSHLILLGYITSSLLLSNGRYELYSYGIFSGEAIDAINNIQLMLDLTLDDFFAYSGSVYDLDYYVDFFSEVSEELDFITYY